MKYYQCKNSRKICKYAVSTRRDDDLSHRHKDLPLKDFIFDLYDRLLGSYNKLYFVQSVIDYQIYHNSSTKCTSVPMHKCNSM